MSHTRRYHLSEDDKRQFAATFLIDHMEREKRHYDVLLDGGDSDLSPILQWLLMKGHIEINDEHHYALTQSGHDKAQQFALRYQALLTYFDLFGYVDLESGDFAFEKVSDFERDSAWQQFLADPRWFDLRLPLIEHLGGNPIELVFCQFVREKRISTANDHWQLELVHGSLWGDILDICENAITPEQLTFEEDDGHQVSGEAILDDVAEQGFLLLRELHPADPAIHSNLQAWHPRHGYRNDDLPPPMPGFEKPIWQQPWTL
ncbi:MAG: hypothetical protein ACQKBY_03815 [Verrucomicrobiales bacterium]